jgi:rhodanese-related sulfurtransferase
MRATAAVRCAPVRIPAASPASAAARRPRRSVAAAAAGDGGSAASAAAPAGGWPRIGVEAAYKVLFQESGCVFLDLRGARAYDEEHLTKPPRCSVNAPLPVGGAPAGGPPPAAFAAALAKVPRSSRLLVASEDGGADAEAAMGWIAAAGYKGAALVEGGYAAWRAVFSTSGRRRPPPGRWMPSGTGARAACCTLHAAFARQLARCLLLPLLAAKTLAPAPLSQRRSSRGSTSRASRTAMRT